ncbi:MAG: zinc ribbon domain-containing protein, partial [Pyrinomonadaceae bacterium]
IEAALGECEPEINRLGIELADKIQAFEIELKDESEKLENHKTERVRVLSTLPKQMVTLYDRIMARIRNGIAVAEARNGSCTACFMSLRPQIMAQIRRNDEIITCDNCGRILFFSPTGELDGATQISSTVAAAQSPAAGA